MSIAMNTTELKQKISQRSKFELLTVADLVSRPSPAWLLDGMIEENAIAVLYGPSGCGKSLAALDWAMSISEGRPWHGHDVKRGPVVYVVGEGTYGVAKRVRAWMKHNAVEHINTAFFTLTAPQMLKADDVTELITTLRPHTPALIILDTLAQCFIGGDENAAKEMGQFVEGCRQLQRDTGASVLLVHHTGKGGSLPNVKPTERGSSALRGAADVMIRLESKKGIVIVSNDKQKDEEEFNSVAFRIEQVDLGMDDATGREIRSAVLVSTCAPPENDPDDNEDLAFALDVLRTDLRGSARSGQWHEAILKKEGIPMSKRTFQRRKEALLTSGAIELVPGQRYSYRVVDRAIGNDADRAA